MPPNPFDTELDIVNGHEESPICFTRKNVRKFVQGCYTQGVPRKNVIEALKNSENIYNDWWLGERIQNRENMIHSPRLGYQANLDPISNSEMDESKTIDKLSIDTVKTYLLYILKEKTCKPEENPQFIYAWNRLHSYYLNEKKTSTRNFKYHE